MGLDLSHGCWHGAYGAFDRWRTKLAITAGYATAKFKLQDEFIERETVLIDWGHITTENLQGEWDKTPDDSLIVIIAHSDSDGCIYPEQAKALIPRLKELLPKLSIEYVGGHIGNFRDKTDEFIKGLEDAVKKDEVVDFH